MMNGSGKRQSISNLMALLVFGLFAVCILAVLLTGAETYQSLNRRDQFSYDNRTCGQFMATKVRQALSGDTVSVVSFGDGDALEIYEYIRGTRYISRIYCYEGWLREVFAASERELAPEEGEKILQARDMRLSIEDGLLYISLTDGNGQPVHQVLSLRGGKGAVL